MTTFLFWNLKNKPLTEIIGRLAFQHEIDVLMFAEFSIEPALLLKELNRQRAEYFYAPDLFSKIHIFTRFDNKFITPVYDGESNRLTIRHLKLPGMTDILLAAIHFPSKLHQRDESQASESVELSREIRETEKNVGHSRTVLVGDLNMNPFEAGLVNANGFNAVSSRGIAKRNFRTVQNRGYPFFYNPMWSFMGDLSPGPPGTFYFTKSEHNTFFWNMFDQILIRPDLMNSFISEELKILDSDGKISFLKSDGIPDDRIVSDHLPLLFKLNL